MHKIISYLLIPDFHLQLHCLYYPADRRIPLLIGGSADEYGLVLEASGKAREQGLRPGMRCSDAAVRCPGIKIASPARERYSDYSSRILRITASFSLKSRKDLYNSFYLFLPDYFHRTETIRRIQKEIKNKLGLSTRMGVSVNQRSARLAALAAAPDQALFLDRQNAANVFKGRPVSMIRELDAGQEEKLRMAGVRTIPDLLNLGLDDLKFILGASGPALYRNYLEQLKTVRDEDPFLSEEIFLCNAENDPAVLKKRVSEAVKELLARSPSICRMRIRAEYVDHRCLFWTGRAEREMTEQSLVQILMRVLLARRRRVRVRKLRIGVLPSAFIPLSLPGGGNTI